MHIVTTSESSVTRSIFTICHF